MSATLEQAMDILIKIRDHTGSCSCTFGRENCILCSVDAFIKEYQDEQDATLSLEELAEELSDENLEGHSRAQKLIGLIRERVSKEPGCACDAATGAVCFGHVEEGVKDGVE